MEEVSQTPIRWFKDQHGQKHRHDVGMPIVWRVSAYALIVGQGREVLLVVPTWQDMYDLPGCGIEPDEGIRCGIPREVLEETGYECIASPQPLSVYECDFYDTLKEQFCRSLILIYTAKLNSHIQAEGKINRSVIKKVEWVCIRDLRRDNVHDMFWPIIDGLRSGAIPWPEPMHVF